MLRPKEHYPNDWIEIPIFTHLPGDDPKSRGSRNILNVASADVILVLAGGTGTQAELEIALGLDKPLIAFLDDRDAVGDYGFATLARIANCVADEPTLRNALEEELKPLRLTRPSFATLKAVYKTNPTDIHSCTMQFPNTCAIRLSEALDQVVLGIKEKFTSSGLNVCPHGFMRGAEDLAGVLRKADVFGTNDAGFSAPDEPPEGIKGKKGIVACMNIPTFPGQGHIDLWDGSAPVGEAYWTADPVWFWKLDYSPRCSSANLSLSAGSTIATDAMLPADAGRWRDARVQCPYRVKPLRCPWP